MEPLQRNPLQPAPRHAGRQRRLPRHQQALPLRRPPTSSQNGSTQLIPDRPHRRPPTHQHHQRARVRLRPHRRGPHRPGPHHRQLRQRQSPVSKDRARRPSLRTRLAVPANRPRPQRLPPASPTRPRRSDSARQPLRPHQRPRHRPHHDLQAQRRHRRANAQF